MGRIENAVFGAESNVQRFRQELPHFSDETESPMLKLFVDLGHAKHMVGEQIAANAKARVGSAQAYETFLNNQAAILRYDTFFDLGRDTHDMFNKQPDFSIDLPTLSTVAVAAATERLDRKFAARDEEAVLLRGLEVIHVMGKLLTDPDIYREGFLEKTFRRAAAMRQAA